jgi:muramoyltetrapeptide carboxypeptidase
MAIWPPPVRPGDRVGVAALSGAADADSLQRGLATLRELGYQPVAARNLESRWGPLAGDDEERLAAFHELLADDSLAAIFFLRGGHGLLRIVDRLDWALIGARPRAWVGYSDLTPLLLRIVERCGWVTLHGPMVATDLARGLDADEASSLVGALAGEPVRELPLRWLREGAAEGQLLGGCLSLLAAVAGTAWQPQLRDALLFVEDVNEPAYKVDRMLTHLRLSGTLSSVRAMIAGHFGAEWQRGIEEPIGVAPTAVTEPGSAAEWQRESLLALVPPTVPVAFGLPSGHGRPHLTLPLGAWARLVPATASLRLD